MSADEAIGRISAAPDRTGLFCDFDGTLAPIVDDPGQARMAPGLAPLLEDLAGRLGLLAVVSGRPAEYLGAHAAVPGVALHGLYGLERWHDGRVVPRAEAAQWTTAVERAKTALAEAVADAGPDGLRLEDKGLGVALHWRNAPDREQAAAVASTMLARVAADTGLRREPGKLVEELRPPVDWDKGTCVRALADEVGVTLPVYLGDDLGDLPAFRAVADLGGIGIAVAGGDETPPQLANVVELELDGTRGVVDWLTALADRLGRGAG